MTSKIDAYNDFAAPYSEMVTRREQAGIENEPIMPHFLKLLGDISGLTVLDAGCGQGYLSRILASRGAHVTGIDISENLIQIAREQDPSHQITYEVANLCQPLPAYSQHFDLVVSHFVLDDVYDHKGFLSTLGNVIKSGGHAILSMNNPYSMVVRGHVHDYFDTGKPFSYRGMAEAGVKVHFYHHTLEEHLDACFAAGFQLQRLLDIPTPVHTYRFHSDALIKPGYQFPFFIVLSLIKN
ncbi:MAG TPA: class I SAM-dependent methyltransferase [Ktedonosporobacter sp.]|nr:class I SAM-dependent methyltransferase [Ktedonosporobacter sp.]